MTTKNEIIFFSVWIFYLLSHIENYRFEPNSFTLNNVSVCPQEDKNSVHLNVSIEKVDRNKFLVNGEAIYDEPLHGPFEVNGLDNCIRLLD